MSESIIKISNIGKKYTLGVKEPYYSLRDTIVDFFTGKKKKGDEFWALKNVSFEVQRGEVIGIIGRNGAGKSTLLKILSRITPPTEGKIEMHGRVASLLEVGTGFNPELSGRENIYLNGAILGMSKKEIDEKFDAIVEFSEIGKFLDTPVKRYSSGMYVRLAFSVAAHLEPEILIVDEVLAVGDANFQKKCLGKMGDVAKGGRTVLFVSHNMGAVKQLCDRCVFLEKGEVKMVGETGDVLQKYLGENVNSEAQIEYAENPEKKVQIRKISILDKGNNPNHDIDISEKFFVKVEYDVREDIQKRNYVCLTLTDSNNNIILQTFDIDSGEEYYEKRGKGKYESVFEFPANLFNQQMIKISIQCGIPLKYNLENDKDKFIDQKDEIGLNLFNGNSFSKKFFGGSRGGLFMIKFESVIKKLI